MDKSRECVYIYMCLFIKDGSFWCVFKGGRFVFLKKVGVGV